MKDTRKCRMLPLESPEDYVLMAVSFGINENSHLAVAMAFSPGQRQYVVALADQEKHEYREAQAFQAEDPQFGGDKPTAFQTATLYWAARSRALLEAYGTDLHPTPFDDAGERMGPPGGEG